MSNEVETARLEWNASNPENAMSMAAWFIRTGMADGAPFVMSTTMGDPVEVSVGCFGEWVRPLVSEDYAPEGSLTAPDGSVLSWDREFTMRADGVEIDFEDAIAMGVRARIYGE